MWGKDFRELGLLSVGGRSERLWMKVFQNMFYTYLALPMDKFS